ncbi:MAG: DUF4276 family protein [Acetobacteraceae bacterium]|nr:DUF4276 family protein [Acetobacteraceae bacterium]
MTQRIAIIVEGETEKIFEKALRDYLSGKLPGQMPRLKFISEDGRILTGDKLKRDVGRLLARDHDAVIALTDVYTGARPPGFVNAEDAKRKMREWVGPEPRFHPHAAQYEFEAWLFPFWSTIQRLSGTNRNPPPLHPETVNHDRPPATHLKELFLSGKRRAYVKTRDGAAILRDQNLEVSAARCPELRAFLDTILSIAAP